MGGLQFARSYNSQNTIVTGTLGTAWRHHYDSTIAAGIILNGTPAVFAGRPDGKSYAFVTSGSGYQPQDADIQDKLVELRDGSGARTGWTYTVAADQSIETYNSSGKLVSVTERSGLSTTLTYSDTLTPATVAPRAGLLLRVADTFGRQLNFTYDSNGRISTMTDANGASYGYAYDGSNNPVSVTYPDGKAKRYHYNEAAHTEGTNLPHALTGITDENGVRFASYFYHADGKAYRSEHAGGVDQYQVSFGSDGSSSTITDPLGTARTTHFTTILGVIKATGQSQPGGSGCGPAASAITYDANGNVASRTDFNGAKTTYSYDLARNLETSRTEAAGTAQARTISTEWHPAYRLPVRMAEPNKRTVYTYDDSGNLLSKTEQATTDASGSQGFAATTTGTARSWQYTYNPHGQVLSATGPRGDTSTYTYDSQGNLTSVTNASGQVTTLADYDANGRVHTITGANGLLTTLTYSPRGWLTSRKAGNEVTTYEYDGVGQLLKVVQPDGSFVTYTYDDAHRLTGIADSLGNRIGYTLDAMGNRVQEQVTDPSGQLAQQTTRVYDALNRLQQITGGMQ